MPKLKIAFHLYMLGFRGTEVATYDYANYNERILGNESTIIVSTLGRGCGIEPEALKKFTERFRVIFYDNNVYEQAGIAEIAALLKFEGVHALYNHELYYDAEWRCPGVFNIVHATFPWCKPRGDAFAWVSDWLARPTGLPVVPLMVDLPNTNATLRDELNLPPNATVIGRHGGNGTFDNQIAHAAVAKAVELRPDLYFLFLNTDAFMPPHPRVIHLPATRDLIRKTAFINTCDAMLDGHRAGETFGLAVAEFSIRNKPVFVCPTVERKAHIEILGNRGLHYRDVRELVTLLTHFVPQPQINWDAYSQRYTPRPVMQTFAQHFLAKL